MTAQPDIRVLAEAADRIVEKGFAAPAIFLLEMHKPLTAVLQSTYVMFSWLSSAVLGNELSASIGKILESRDSVEAFIHAIETRDAEYRRRQIAGG